MTADVAAFSAALADMTDQVVRYTGIWATVFVLLLACVMASLGTPGVIFAVFPGTVLCSWLARKLA